MQIIRESITFSLLKKAMHVSSFFFSRTTMECRVWLLYLGHQSTLGRFVWSFLRIHGNLSREIYLVKCRSHPLKRSFARWKGHLQREKCPTWPQLMTKLLSLRNKPVRLSWCSLWYTKAASFADNFACSLTLLLLPLSLIPPAREENQAPIHNRWRTWRITCQISPQATSSFETGRGRFRALRQICKCLEAEMVSPYKDKTWGRT